MKPHLFTYLFFASRLTLRVSLPGPSVSGLRGSTGRWSRQEPLARVGIPAVGVEAELRSEGADVLVPVCAVEQVALEALPGLPLVLLHRRHGAVRLRAAGMQTVLPGVHPVGDQQERGPLLDGGLGLDDAVPDGAEVAHAGVGAAAELVRLFLLQMLAEFLQQLFHP